MDKVSKAVAGALVTLLAAYLLKHGVTLDPVVTNAAQTLVEALIAALAGYLAVYWAPKNSEK